MIGDLLLDKNKNPIAPVSDYQPPEPVTDLTSLIMRDYGIGIRIQRQTFAEFNDMSLLDRMDKDQKAFNSYVLPPSDDPDESWRWNGVRPVTRNKVMSIAAIL